MSDEQKTTPATCKQSLQVGRETTPAPRAWLVWPKGWPIDETGQHMVIAPTRGKAIAHSLRAAREAGYKLRLPDMRAVRYPAGDPR